jgi:hypothetical protein
MLCRSLAPPATAECSRSVAEWEGRCVVEMVFPLKTVDPSFIGQQTAGPSPSQAHPGLFDRFPHKVQ